MRNRWMWSLVAVLSFAFAPFSRAEPDLSTPRSAAIVFAKAVEEGDMTTAKSAATVSEGSDAFMDAMGSLVKSSKKLEAAVIAKFGDAGKQIISAEKKDVAAELNAAQLKEAADTAEITTDNPEQKPLKLRKVDGAWKVDLTSVMPPSEMPRATAVFSAMSVAMTDLVQEVNDGKYPSPEVAKTAVDMKLMAAMQAGVAETMPAASQPAGPPSTQPATAPEADVPAGRPVEDMK